MSVTKIAVLADVHADVHSLQAALTHIERLGCAETVCAGDLVQYGLFPEETIALLRERGVACVRGNNDRWALGHGRADEPEANDEAQGHDASGWDLSPASLAFLAGLPATRKFERDGVRVAVCHGTPGKDMEGVEPEEAGPDDVRRWLATAAADVLVTGHTHRPFELCALGGGMVVNPGAILAAGVVGASGASDPGVGGTFGVLELPSRQFSVHRADDGREIEIARVSTGVRDRRRGV